MPVDVTDTSTTWTSTYTASCPVCNNDLPVCEEKMRTDEFFRSCHAEASYLKKMVKRLERRAAIWEPVLVAVGIIVAILVPKLIS